MKNEIVLFEAEDKSITIPVQVTAETVWLNRNQLADLFGRDIKTIGKHIGNALKEELDESEVVAKFATTTSTIRIQPRRLFSCQGLTGEVRKNAVFTEKWKT